MPIYWTDAYDERPQPDAETRALIRDAADAEDVCSLDELEAYARRQRERTNSETAKETA